MLIHRIISGAIFLLLLSKSGVCQNNTVAAGGNASGTTGSVSFSMGQPFITIATNGSLTVTPGLQQPLEVSLVTGVRNPIRAISAKVYPNPTTAAVVLDIELRPGDRFEATLQNAEGKLLQSLLCTHNRTIIRLDGLPAGIYYLKISGKEQQVTVFQIVKSN